MADVPKVELAALTEAQLADLDTNELLDTLGAIAARIAVVETERDQLYARRLAIYQEARRREPPITQRALAERAQVSEVAVIQALRKSRQNSGAA